MFIVKRIFSSLLYLFSSIKFKLLRRIMYPIFVTDHFICMKFWYIALIAWKKDISIYTSIQRMCQLLHEYNFLKISRKRDNNIWSEYWFNMSFLKIKNGIYIYYKKKNALFPTWARISKIYTIQIILNIFYSL